LRKKETTFWGFALLRESNSHTVKCHQSREERQS